MQTLTGDLASAETSLREALEVHLRLRTPYWTARTQLDLANLLAIRQAPEDVVAAAALAEQARQTAGTYRLEGLRNHSRFAFTG